MFAMVWTVLVAVFLSASCFHGMPIDETEIPKPSPDRDNYKEEREVRSAATSLPVTDHLPKITTEMPKHVLTETKEEVSFTTSSTFGSTKIGSETRDTSIKMRREAFLVQQGLLPWTPYPTESNPYNYDDYLGKVRRDAPIPSSSTVSSTQKIMESVKVN